MSGAVPQMIKEAFQRTSLRCTPQRYAVLEYLVRHEDHPTADQICVAINARDPRASRATVYNNLHALTVAGVVREVVLDPGPVRYDANLQHHHHFVCERCGGLDDITAFHVPQVLKRSSLGSRIVREYEIVFRRLCEQCSIKNQNKRGVAKWEKLPDRS